MSHIPTWCFSFWFKTHGELQTIILIPLIVEFHVTACETHYTSDYCKCLIICLLIYNIYMYIVIQSFQLDTNKVDDFAGQL